MEETQQILCLLEGIHDLLTKRNKSLDLIAKSREDLFHLNVQLLEMRKDIEEINDKIK